MSINEPVWLIAENIRNNPEDYTVIPGEGVRVFSGSCHKDYTIYNKKLQFKYQYRYSEETLLALGYALGSEISESIRIPGIDLTEHEEELLIGATKRLFDIKDKEKEEQKKQIEKEWKLQELEERNRLTELFGNV